MLWEKTLLISGIQVSDSSELLLVLDGLDEEVDVDVVVGVIVVKLDFLEDVVSTTVESIDLSISDLLIQRIISISSFSVST